MDKIMFNKEFFAGLAKKHGLYSTMFKNLGHGHGTEIIVEEKYFDRLVQIQNKLERFSVMGDDEKRAFYLVVPRPSPEEWGNCDEDIALGEYESRKAWLENWEDMNPSEFKWVHFISGRYKETRTLLFSTGALSYFTISNASAYENRRPISCNEYRWFLDAIFPYLDELVDLIQQDVDGFNDYVAEHLPYNIRKGVISRKMLHQILPDRKIRIQDEALAIEALESSADDAVPSSLEKMTIRTYCKYYRIANEAYVLNMSKIGADVHTTVVPDTIPENDRDVYYYVHAGLKHVEDGLDYDSQEDFLKFAVGHYSELGFSRINILASDNFGPGWKIVVSSSYSAYADTAIDVATALYRAGTPLYVMYADRYLQLIREEGNVRFVSCSFHDYMSHHEEASVMTLPSEYQCRKYPEEGIDIEQYEKIVSSAHWEEEERLLLCR